MAEKQEFTPFVPPEKSISETTFASITLGLVLAVIMAAANAYAGLYAGMTASASIPAAVISMGILKGVLKRGTILENNMVQTIASSGESLAAGIIFTVPALVLVGVWQDFKFWPVTLIAILGGLMGVLFMIPLRRSLIVEDKELKFPEAVACAEMLEVGETRGSGIKYVFSAVGVGVVLKGFVDAIPVVKESVETAWGGGKSVYYFGCDMSALLIGVGYIVGINIATLVFLGGAIGWIVAIPIYTAVHGIPAGETVLDSASSVWSTQIRYMGIGAMVVGGISSIIKVRRGIAKGLRRAILGRQAVEPGPVVRTDQDMSQRLLLIMSIACIVGMFVFYFYLTGAWGVTLISTLSMVVAGFFFVAVASYIVGLVGGSNSPVSGMTICAILFASGLLLIAGMRGNAGILAALGVAGVVCSAASMAGDISQDLKTGYFVGATPRRQQWGEVLGVLVPAFVIAPVLTLLHKAYGIGSDRLSAPQANLFAGITRAMFTEQPMPWVMVGIGLVIGLGLLAADEVLRRRGSAFRTHVMPVAVGIYLPLSLSVPIIFGGIVSLATRRIARRRGDEEGSVHRGILFGSGLIAGEAIMGIAVALMIVSKVPLPEEPIIESNLLSLALFGLAVAALAYVCLKPERRKDAS